MLICSLYFSAFCQHLLPVKWQQVSKAKDKLLERKKIKTEEHVAGKIMAF